MEYKPNKENIAADALSRKSELANISQPTSGLRERIKQGLQQDSLAQSYMTSQEGKI